MVGAVSKGLVEVSRADILWMWHVRELADKHVGVSLGRRDDQRTFEFYMDFLEAIERGKAQDGAAVIADFSQTGLPR